MAGEPVHGSFGRKLREARERRGISLRQIAAATKISVGVLEALEHEDIARLPGGIFTRSFVRSYAIHVGLDPETIVQEFLAQFPSDSATAGHRMAERSIENDNIESNRRAAVAFLWMLAISVPVIGAVMYFGVTGRRAAQKHAAPVPVARADRSGPAGSATPVDDRLLVAMTASAPIVISTAVDDGETVERTMQAGDHQEWEVRREMVLTTSDAGGTGLTLDGAAAKPLGKAGEPATVRLTPANYKEFVAVQ